METERDRCGGRSSQIEYFTGVETELVGDRYRPAAAMSEANERRARGKGRHQAIVTIVDRKSKLLRMKKVNRKTGTLVRIAICDKLKGLTVHTLTSDNGSEFSEHKKIAKTLNANFYFCHPYWFWERGLNENTNGLIRQYFPKHEVRYHY